MAKRTSALAGLMAPLANAGSIGSETAIAAATTSSGRRTPITAGRLSRPRRADGGPLRRRRRLAVEAAHRDPGGEHRSGRAGPADLDDGEGVGPADRLDPASHVLGLR